MLGQNMCKIKQNADADDHIFFLLFQMTTLFICGCPNFLFADDHTFSLQITALFICRWPHFVCRWPHFFVVADDHPFFVCTWPSLFGGRRPHFLFADDHTCYADDHTFLLQMTTLFICRWPHFVCRWPHFMSQTIFFLLFLEIFSSVFKSPTFTQTWVL